MRWHLFPWPTRTERRRRIEEARAGAIESRRDAVRAGHLRRDLTRIAYEKNHWAARVAGQIQHYQGE